LASDKVVVERQLKVVVNTAEFASLHCTPVHLDELCLGFLWSAGLISPEEPLPLIEIDERFLVAHVTLEREVPVGLPTRNVFAGCGTGLMPWDTGATVEVLDDGARYDWREISEASSQLLRGNSLFAETGGSHAALMCEKGSEGCPDILREDIGRHNAVDKVGGYLVLHGQARAGSNRFLVVTGRISSDLVLKAAVFGFPLLISRGAPTDLAIRYAQNSGITLVGFSRAERMNIYTYPRRIIAARDH
jgi:FdhD protein